MRGLLLSRSFLVRRGCDGRFRLRDELVADDRPVDDALESRLAVETDRRDRDVDLPRPRLGWSVRWNNDVSSMALRIAVTEAGSSSGGNSSHRCIGFNPFVFESYTGVVLSPNLDTKYRLLRLGSPRCLLEERGWLWSQLTSCPASVQSPEAIPGPLEFVGHGELDRSLETIAGLPEKLSSGVSSWAYCKCSVESCRGSKVAAKSSVADDDEGKVPVNEPSLEELWFDQSVSWPP